MTHSLVNNGNMERVLEVLTSGIQSGPKPDDKARALPQGDSPDLSMAASSAAINAAAVAAQMFPQMPRAQIPGLIPRLDHALSHVHGNSAAANGAALAMFPAFQHFRGIG